MKIRVRLHAEPDGGFSATCPELPGCVSQGNTKDEAIANIREAIALYLEPTPGDADPDAEDVIIEM